jgi:serine/threonine-protein kinase
MNAPPLPIGRFRGDVPEELQAVLLKCLEKEREDRYPSMGALARALEGFADERGRVHALRASAVLRAAETARATADPPSTLREGGKPTTSGTQGGILVHEAPEGAPVGREQRPRKNGTPIWLVVGGAVSVLAATVGALLARGTARSDSTVASPNPVSTTPPAAPPVPVATVEVPSVPVDSLPLSAQDAGAPRAATPIARKMPPPPAASSVSSAAPKEGWKWGDRN